MRRWTSRALALTALIAAVAFVAFILDRGGDGHTLRAAFDSAVQVVPGQEVRLGGRKVGRVADVQESDGRAIVELEISDDDAWPLPRGTVARLRWGSNTGYAIRYVDLLRPRNPTPALPDGGLLTQTITPVELDQSYRIFRGRTKEDLGELVGELGATFGPRARPLARSLRRAPGGLDALADLLRELGADRVALRTVAREGARTARAIESRDLQLRDMLVHLGGTFDELAEHTTAQQRSLERLPPALAASRTTLARLDRSLVGLQALTGDLRPGARALRALAPSARTALRELRDVAPLATGTLERGVRASAPLRRLLTTGTAFLPGLGSVLDQLEPMAGCVRPYGPEIMGQLSNWIGFSQNYDAQGHYVRAFLQQPPIEIGTHDNSAQVIASHPGMKYAFPRPPGYSVGQPWFQPQCGAGPDALDPEKDPEGAGK